MPRVAQFLLDTMILSIVVIYTPSDSSKTRAYMWHQLKGELPDGQWIMLGDYNMTESSLDSSRPSPLLNGRQQEAWRLLKTRLDLVDTFSLAHTFKGTQFTQQVVYTLRLDQSRLDKFCLSGKGHWIHSIIQLEHVQA